MNKYQITRVFPNLIILHNVTESSIVNLKVNGFIL